MYERTTKHKLDTIAPETDRKRKKRNKRKTQTECTKVCKNTKSGKIMIMKQIWTIELNKANKSDEVGSVDQRMD